MTRIKQLTKHPDLKVFFALLTKYLIQKINF